jgi:diaminopimelate decarboxylase
MTAPWPFPFRHSNGRLVAVVGEKAVDVAMLAGVPQGASAVERDFTPTYIYNLRDIANRTQTYLTALSPHPATQARKPWTHTVHFAMKSNHSPGVLRTVLAQGAGVDTVSWGEIACAIRAGARPDQIIFSGVGKSNSEIRNAIECGIKQINCESEAELARIVRQAQSRRAGLPPVAVALRLNPDVNPETHKYIATGFRDNKFGIDEVTCVELAERLKAHNDAVQFVGLTMHIGSQLLSNTALLQASERITDLSLDLIRRGHKLRRIDLGGGIGIDYSSDNVEPELNRLGEFGARIQPLLCAMAEAAPDQLEVLSEPGRFLVARAGVLVTRVEYIKEHHASAGGKRFAIVNTGMHHLLRPALYEARHRVVPLSLPDANARGDELIYDVVGPICESSDVLAREVSLPRLAEGDALAILDSGAYGATMASDYNLHERPREVDTPL